MSEFEKLIDLLKDVVLELLIKQESEITSQIKLDISLNPSIHRMGGKNDKKS